MKKKVLIGASVFLAFLVASGLYVTQVLNKRSPAATVTCQVGGGDVKIDYHRPYKKNRVIFGDQDALVPYGQYWRLGANEATSITFAKAASFAGKPVAAGTYRMYAVPGATSWKVVLNSELGWGAREADHGKDVLTVEVPAEAAPQALDQFTISCIGEPTGAKMSFAWDTTLVSIPLAAN